MPSKDYTGTRFGRLVAAERIPGRDTCYRCICDCGGIKTARTGDLVSGRTKSCGCLQQEARRESYPKHGQHGSPTYRVWQRMLCRCENPKYNGYHNYGGRGIAVCQRWHRFENFLADMGLRPEGGTLDRFPDKDGNYEPGNCRWATMKQQQNNRRNNVILEHQGRNQTLAQWAQELSLDQRTLGYRVNAGWPIEKALTTPPRPTYHRKT